MKKLLIQLGNFFRMTFTNAFDYIGIQAEGAIKVINIIKAVTDSPITQAIVLLTPTTADDAILYQAKRYISIAAAQMFIFKDILDNNSTPEEVIKAITDHLKTLTKDQKVSFYMELSGRITQALADGRVTISEATNIAWFIYETKYKNK